MSTKPKVSKLKIHDSLTVGQIDWRLVSEAACNPSHPGTVEAVRAINAYFKSARELAEKAKT